ncbi:hypothetical protein [Gandjariella thermophila]|uniref:Uncharacterized protein n=1 Tax=Gandjariella thermophila TaxID=1931992 RepID=A0A4D4JEW9_9PSEU|nr:hypothetical protein [Gandjariella thermophila]GDY33952.1 hypothetical protein GTS_55850 [Gandjariella thermophila]
MIEVDPRLRLILVLAGLGALPVWMLATAVARWWSTSLTVVVARARLDAWCTCFGRDLRSKLPAASLPLVGGRVLPTAGPVAPNAGLAVSHPGRTA